ncbi:PEP-CTERM sorting domain-containing protein [Verrucomicrobium spinosum]|uniref:PEP-CTERM sorting domain-containing protein n=1 Tax=Verrucomicrobium spinosum TaxID=2736 RepID=UPI0012F6D9C1|nr:PEP-CTERM sorting domain-containing protein [Verrucomicrobium spinosum]
MRWHCLRLFLIPTLIVVSTTLKAATVLYSHEGATDPTTEGWAKSASGATTIVTSAYTDTADSNRESWRIYDPGEASGGTGLYYQAVLTAPKTADILSTGWEYNATLKVPTLDPNENTAWSTGSNTWVGFLAANDGLGNRRAWALMFGRNATGGTVVSLFGGTSRTLDPGYHDYSMVYDPTTKLATVSIDGEVWLTNYAGSNQGAAAGSNLVYWGDNNSQSASQTARAAYYESVEFIQYSTAPEPGRMLLFSSALVVWAMRRRRG